MIDLVTADTLFDWKKSHNVYLIDVREQDEYSSSHIQGAHLYPLSNFDPKDIQKQNTPIVFYCRSGARSHHAASVLKNLHPDWEIYNLQGGIISWLKQGFSTE